MVHHIISHQFSIPLRHQMMGTVTNNRFALLDYRYCHFSLDDDPEVWSCVGLALRYTVK
jgi:hypothetical protein